MLGFSSLIRSILAGIQARAAWLRLKFPRWGSKAEAEPSWLELPA